MNAQQLRAHAGIFLGLGLALIALGSLAIYSVVFATFASVIFIGWLLVFSGFIQLGHALYARNWSGFLLQLFLGIFALVAGALILYMPTAGALSLTLLLSFLFIAQGVVRIVLSLTRRFENWVWVLISGILTLILGILILKQWPYSALYIIGLFVGIDLIFNGWALVMLSFAAKKLAK
jgi:uncharacterized membrane protein HdeD (DUF308 family)